MLSSTRASSTVNVPARRLAWFRRRHLRLAVPATVVALIAGLALFAPWVSPYSPEAIDPTVRFAPPSHTHVLGADEFGRDILSELAFGARISLLVSAASASLAGVVGTALGTIAAFSGGPMELLIMRIADALLCFPPILLAIFVITFLGSSLLNVILVIALLYVPPFARLAHSSTLTVREAEYVTASRVAGSGGTRILRRDILPNIMAPLFVQLSLALGHIILLESGLSFLGLGPPPPVPSWGRMIGQSSRFMSLGVLPVVWPAVMVSTTILAFNLLGDAVRDALDPRLRGA